MYKYLLEPTFDCLLNVGVIKDDERRVPASLDRNPETYLDR